MCPIWPLHLITLYLLALCPMWVLCQGDEYIPKLKAKFVPAKVETYIGGKELVNVTVVYTQSGIMKEDVFYVTSLNNKTASAKWILKDVYHATEKTKPRETHYQGRFIVTGHHIEQLADADGAEKFSTGDREVYRKTYRGTVDKTTAKESKLMYTLQNETALGTLPVYVLRSERFQLLKTMCITGVFLFVLLIFIYFGCAMDWPTMEDLLTTPIGLVSLLIGMLGKFLFLPYMSLWLGSVIFPNAPAMRLSMFFTGVSPVCGTAIIWTFLVRGNLDLSIVMTCVSMLGSFVFMPAWLRYIDWIEYKNANVVVPYQTIPPYAGWFLPLPFLGLIVPLAIGYAIQTWMPRFADSMVNFLESFCIAVALFFMLLFFNIICAIIPNWDISWFVTGKVIIAGICIAWMGYLFGYLVMRMFGLPHPDAIAVAIVTGMLNTSIPTVLLCYVLPNPDCDLLSVIPLAVAVMLVIPLITICICMVLVPCCRRANRPRRLPPAILHKLPLEPIPRSVIINA